MSVRYRDYYRILGVERTATTAEITKAYRRLAQKWHPDHNKSPDAVKRFQDLNEAKAVLTDPEKRARYDRLGSGMRDGQEFRSHGGGFEHAFEGAGAGGASFSDFFSSLFGDSGAFAGTPFSGGRRGPSPRRGQDVEAEVELSLAEVLRGGKRSFSFETMVSKADGSVGNETRHVELKIPDGVKDGTKVRLRGQGGPGRGGEPGDLLLKVRLARDPRFEADGHDLHAKLNVPAYVVALGGSIDFAMLDGKQAAVRIAAGTKVGSMLRLRGQGLPRGGELGRADLLLTVAVEVPSGEPTDEQRAAWERLRDSYEGGETDAADR